MDTNQERILTDCLAAINRMEPQIVETRSDVRFLRSEVVKIREKNVAQDCDIERIDSDLDSLGSKVRTHIADTIVHAGQQWHSIREHWKFIGIVVGLFSVALGLLNKL